MLVPEAAAHAVSVPKRSSGDTQDLGIVSVDELRVVYNLPSCDLPARKSDRQPASPS